MRLVGCVRVSRVAGRAGDNFISVDVQREQIEGYARARGHEIIAWREDLDKPGSTLNRPGLKDALRMVETGEADGIIAAKLDRITRSVAGIGHLLERAKTNGWNLIAVDLGLDLRTPNGKLVANVLGSVAEWELDRRRQDWDSARKHAVARGVHVASRTPTGYRRLQDGRLEPDPVAAPAVRAVFQARATGKSWGELAGMLHGIIGPYGNKAWTMSAVTKLIRNRVYLGEARSGKHTLAAAHEPIVTRAEWEAAQQARALPSSRLIDAPLLAGLVRCASCRYLLKADTMNDRGKRLRLYRCRGRHAAGHCPQPVSILGRVIEPYVEQKFLVELELAPLADPVLRNRDAEQALSDLQAADDELAAYLDTTIVAFVGRDTFQRGVETRQRRIDEARERLIAAAPTSGIRAYDPQDIREQWPTLTTEQRRVLLGTFYDWVVVFPHQLGRPTGDRVLLVERGDAPVDLPRRGHRVPLASWPDNPVAFGVALPADTNPGLLER